VAGAVSSLQFESLYWPPMPAPTTMCMLQVIEDNKLLLKAKYDEAKALGAAVNASKAHILELKGRIELWRAQRAAACE